MSDTSQHVTPGAKPTADTKPISPRDGETPRHLSAALMALLLAAYGLGMARDLSVPWIGLHDWNGAFYSQLARNMIRYPFEDHRAMPLVAVGDAAPATERSIYATHPAGLVWLLAAAFRIAGESEAVARAVAILASLMAMLLWFSRVRRRHDRETALLTGLIYVVLPLSVYYGRMVNHEAFCLPAMILALACWDRWNLSKGRVSGRLLAAVGWCAAVLLGIMIDWPMMLFAGLFCLHASWQWNTGRIPGSRLICCWAVFIGGVLLVLLHMVYGGLEGRWADLIAIFTSRTTPAAAGLAARAWSHTIENFTLPVLALAAIQLLYGALHRLRRSRLPAATRGDLPPASGDAAWVLPATGVIWLALFFRQYQMHQYWVFYLGPAVALAAARGLLLLRDLAGRAGTRTAHGIAGALVLLILYAGTNGSDSIFRRIQCPPEYIAVWKFLREATPPDQIVELPWDPIQTETFGGYTFRNITPPQLAYYLDRPFAYRPSPSSSAPPSSNLPD